MKPVLPLLILAAAHAAAAAAEVPVKDFASFADFDNVTLSPNGEYIATIKQIETHSVLGFIRLADMKVTGGLNFGDYDHVADFSWVGPERIVAEVGITLGIWEQPFLTGELMAIDVDGGRQKYLFGQRGSARKDTRITAYNTFQRAWASMVEPLPQDPDSALIRVTSFGKDVPFHELHRINVYSGERHRELIAPAEHIDHYLTDALGRVRYAAGQDPDKFTLRAYVRNLQDGTWAPVNQGELANAEVLPLNFSEQENAAYFKSDELDGDRDCLIRQDLATGKRTAVACDERQSLAWTINSADRSHPIAAVFSAGKPEVRVLVPESAEGKVLATLVATFPDKALADFSRSLDGTRILFRAYSDRDPGSYFLLDIPKGKLKRVLGRRPWIKPEQMGEQRVLSFKARDGRTLYGFLTLPPGRDPKRLPLVVNPHGGPFGIRDHWGWNAEAQLLASRGYAVLQVNFRGSGGYGDAHFAAGKKNWGADMINDLTDGLRYTVEQGFADPRRVCIYGASYGGYAAMMSAVREPDAYRCVVAFAGVYDMHSFKKDTDITDTKHGVHFMARFVGDTPEIEKEQSPITYLDRLKAPVMIVHGEEDERVPYSQAKQLRAALKERNLPFEWLVKPREGHGFYNEVNRVDFYEKMLAFLDKNIGGAAPGVPAQ